MKAPNANPDQEKRWARLPDIPRRALAWLALAPSWPSELAEAGFPGEAAIQTGASVTSLLSAAAEDGFAIELPAATPWEGSIYTLPGANRLSAQRAFALDEEFGPDYLTRQLIDAAQQMSQVGGKLLSYDSTLSRWTSLATLAGDDQKLADFFNQQVDVAFNRAAVPEVSRWIDAAQPIADVLGGSLLIAVGRARRRLDLYRRRAQDIQALEHYFPRPEQDAAIDQLLRDDDNWALHLAGDGGVGKTMLLRYLANTLAQTRGLAVSRVDFDYLNPDYPKRAPGLLLSALAEEFRLQAGPNMEIFFNRFDESVDKVHNQIAGSLGLRTDPIIPPDGPEMKEVIRLFVDALLKLAEDRQPVLVLDTCEELAKIRPDGTVPDNVAVTLSVLKQVHDQYKRIRVVFAGRRPLAKAGYGWTADSPLDPQPHLRLHLIEHFTERESRDFLTSYHEKIDDNEKYFPGTLTDDVLKLSPAGEGNSRSRFHISDRPDPEAVPRYNAYDLSMYAVWACRDTELTPAKLAAAGRYYYVRERIVTRAAELIRPLVPALAILGRFDSSTLEALLSQDFFSGGTRSDAFTARLREITDLDWVQPDRAAGPGMWRIDGQLRDRLLRYYQDEQGPAYQTARERVRRVLFEETLRRPFKQLTEQRFVVALQVSTDVPEKAAAWWESVEQRFLEEDEWNWADGLLAVLAADPVMDPAAGGRLRAAVQATRAAAYLHVGGSPSPELWTDVAANAARHPIPPLAERLLLRSRLGRDDLEAVLDQPTSYHDPQLLASYIAALERHIERTELDTGTPDRVVAGRLEVMANRVTDPGMKSFLYCLLGRRLFQSGRSDEGRSALERALVGADSQIRPSLDWIPPDDLHSRVEVERLRFMEISKDEISKAAALAPLNAGSIDADRLRSALILRYSVAIQQVEEASAVARKPPRCNVHRYFPPSIVAEQIQVAIQGDPLSAETQLTNMLTGLTGLPDLVLPIERALLRIRWRYRLANASIPPLIQKSNLQSDQQLVALYRHWFIDSTPAVIPDSPEEWPVRSPDGTAQLGEVSVLNRALKSQQRHMAILTGVAEYSRSGDEIGAALLATTGMLWDAADGDRAALSSLIDLARRHYERIPGNLALPSWREVESAARTGKFSDLLDNLRPGFRPAIARLLAALYYSRSGTTSPNDLLNWILKNYSVEKPEGRRIPTELVFLQSMGRPEGSARTLPAWLRSLGVGLAGVVGGLIGLGVLWLMYEAWAWLLRRIGLNLSIAFNLGLLAVLLWLITLVPRLLSRMASLYFRLADTEMQIDPAVTPSDPNRPLEVGGTVTQRLNFAGLRVFKHKFPYQETNEERYAYLTERLWPKTDANRLRRLKKIFLGAVIDVRVVVDSRTAAAPWEAALYLPSHNSKLADSLLRARRSVQRRQLRTPQPRPADTLHVAIWSWAAESSVSRRKLLDSIRTAKGSVSSAIVSTLPTVSPETDVLIIYADPVDSATAVALKVERSARVPQNPVRRGRVTFSQPDDSGLVTTADIVASYPNLRLCIVQCPPTSISARVPSDRRDAAIMRRFGAALYEAGIPAVLILPGGVEQAPAEHWQALTAAWTQAGGPRNTSRRIVEVVYNMQQAIALLQLPDSEAAVEIALDICLYIDERVDLQVQARFGKDKK